MKVSITESYPDITSFNYHNFTAFLTPYNFHGIYVLINSNNFMINMAYKRLYEQMIE